MISSSATCKIIAAWDRIATCYYIYSYIIIAFHRSYEEAVITVSEEIFLFLPTNYRPVARLVERL